MKLDTKCWSEPTFLQALVLCHNMKDVKYIFHLIPFLHIVQYLYGPITTFSIAVKCSGDNKGFLAGAQGIR